MVNQKSDKDFWPACTELEGSESSESKDLSCDPMRTLVPSCHRSEGFGLFVDVVLGFQPFQQRLKKGLRLIRRAADGLRHFFGGVREVA